MWLTDYPDSDSMSDSTAQVMTPHLVKLGEDQFLVMWEETNNANSNCITRMVTIDGNGTMTSDVVTTSMRLSDCAPIVTSDGMVRWYQGDDSNATLYAIDPYQLTALAKNEEPIRYSGILGDADGNEQKNCNCFFHRPRIIYVNQNLSCMPCP